MSHPRDEADEATRLPSQLTIQVQVGIGSVLKKRFVLEAELGKGGMGIVYKALDRRRQETADRNPYVAIKVLNPELAGNESLTIALQRETVRAQQLRHPNIIAAYDFDRDGDVVFMTMEYLEGRALSDILRDRTSFALAEAWPWIKLMGEALAFAHDHGVVHSDFKPSNVFITRDNEVKVMDFGLACKLPLNRSDDLTILDMRAIGAYTPEYATIEMIQGAPPHPSDDIYGFACTIYVLLTGRHPFSRLTALQANEAGLKPKRPPGLSRRQWSALARAMAFSRADRLGSITELLNDLRPQRNILASSLVMAASSILVLGVIGIFLMRSATDVDEPKEVPAATPPPVPAELPRMDPMIPPQPSGAAIDASLVERLGAVRSTSQDQNLAIGLDQASFRLGDSMSLRLAIAKPAHVYVVYVNSFNERVQIYPNEFAPDRPHEANQVHVIPPDVNARFDFPIAEPVGRDHIFVIASSNKIADATARIDALRDSLEVSVADVMIDVAP